MDIKVENNRLIINLPITEGVPSASGKTLVVASTNGFVRVPDTEISVSVNATIPRKR